jgi:hypothetical protein
MQGQLKDVLQIRQLDQHQNLLWRKTNEGKDKWKTIEPFSTYQDYQSQA